ncbi:hypothetical protein ANO11243_010780 [Dothideomycetidae sp. 11243]|nr:hypothetical protein ANO11243_010780 [fungal sp. No.11243]
MKLKKKKKSRGDLLAGPGIAGGGDSEDSTTMHERFAEGNGPLIAVPGQMSKLADEQASSRCAGGRAVGGRAAICSGRWASRFEG